MAGEDVKTEDSLCSLGDGKEGGEGEEDCLWEHLVGLSTSLQAMTDERRIGRVEEVLTIE